jgi:hypothetical protein
VRFANPAESLTVDAGEGDDTVIVEDLDAAYNSTITPTVLGGGGDDTLIASAATHRVMLDGGDGDDILTGGSGDDTLIDGPGSDQLSGGPGNDSYEYTPGGDDLFSDDDGDADTLSARFALQGISINLDSAAEQTVDVLGNTLTLDGQFENFIGSVFNDTVNIRALAVARNVNGNSEVIGLAPGDVLNFAGAGAVHDGDSISTPGLADVIYAGVEEVNLSLSWTNVNPFDVNNADGVTIADVLALVNAFRDAQSVQIQLPDPPTAEFSPPPFLDVNGDGVASLLDLLDLISELREILSGEPEALIGEGEPGHKTDLVPVVDFDDEDEELPPPAALEFDGALDAILADIFATM